MPLTHTVYRDEPTSIFAAMQMQDVLASDLPDTKLILSDLDGCLISGETVLPGVRALVERAGERLWVLSNNSSDTAQTLASRLGNLGLVVPAERILLAGEEAVRRLAMTMPGARVAILAAPPLVTLATELGLQVSRGEYSVEAVLLARDPAFHMADLTRVMRLVHRGVPLWLTNPDPTHPAADGAPVPETGALFAALRAAFPGLRAVCHAKPSAEMVHLALTRSGTTADAAVFLGDTDATDGAAARAAGVPFILLERPSGGHDCKGASA